MLIKRVLIFSFLLVIVIVQRDTVELELMVTPRNCNPLARDHGTHPQQLQIFEGQKLSIAINSSHYINNASCVIDGQRQITNLSRPKFSEGSTRSLVFFHKVNASASKGRWVCTVSILRDVPVQNSMPTPPSHDDNQHNPQCVFNVTVVEKASPVEEWTKNNWIIIGIPVAVVVTLIIIMQTGVIIYFKKKAFRFNRLQTLSMTLRNSAGKDNDKRYSTKPERKMSATHQSHRASDQGDSNQCIYETLNEVHGLESPPVPPIENIPTLKKKKIDADTLRNRKPMPLPVEQFQEEPIPAKSPVSIKPQTTVRPKRDVASSSSTLIRPKPKTGTLTAAEPILSELDHIFKKRQHGSIPGVQTQGNLTPHRKESNLEPKAPHLKHKIHSADMSHTQGNPSPMIVRKESKPEPIQPKPLKGSIPGVQTQGNLTPHRKESNLEPKAPHLKHKIHSADMSHTQGNPSPMIVRKESKPEPIQPKPLKGTSRSQAGSTQMPVRKESIPPKVIKEVPAKPSVVPKPRPVLPETKPSPLPIPVQPKPTHKKPAASPPVSSKPAAQPPSARSDVESVYEQYDNSDEEWTYEPLPEYNIYSI